MRASSANQTSMAAGSTPFSRPISSRRAGKLPEKLRWRRHLVQHVTERLRASSEVGENPGAISVLVIRGAWVCVVYPMSQGVVEQGRDLACRCGHRFGLADARGEPSIE